MSTPRLAPTRPAERAPVSARPRIAGTYGFKTQPDPEGFALRSLSLGAGVQSSRLLLGILEGEFGTPGVDAPSCAIFSDTGWEPAPVMRWMEALKARAGAAGFPVYIVSAVDGAGKAKSIYAEALKTSAADGGPAGRIASIPLYTQSGDGSPMMMRRQCTREYKIEPIEREQRRLLGVEKGRRVKGFVESWQGISYDELSRVRVNQTPWVWNRYPLVERRETRTDCKRWLAARPYIAEMLASVGLAEVPKSACCGCPYRSASEWLWLYENDPEGFASAVTLDEAARTGILGWDQPAYMHRSRRPLAEVIPDLYVLAEEEARQHDLFSASGLVDVCEGICGV